jgi:hypothetical protein
MEVGYYIENDQEKDEKPRIELRRNYQTNHYQYERRRDYERARQYEDEHDHRNLYRPSHHQ